jgi:hypothetical protein
LEAVIAPTTAPQAAGESADSPAEGDNSASGPTGKTDSGESVSDSEPEGKSQKAEDGRITELSSKLKIAGERMDNSTKFDKFDKFDNPTLITQQVETIARCTKRRNSRSRVSTFGDSIGPDPYQARLASKILWGRPAACGGLSGRPALDSRNRYAFIF